MSEARMAEDCLERIFLEARTHRVWQPRAVAPELLREAYALARMGPTSANCSPARFVFVATPEAKARLLPAMAAGNRESVRTSPVTTLVAADTRFYEYMDRLSPQTQLGKVFAENAALAEATAFRNSSLQGAYFILAARALGLDCGPMSGFDAAKIDAEFFPDGRWKVNFVCNLGYGDAAKLFPRAPRLEFEEACRVE